MAQGLNAPTPADRPCTGAERPACGAAASLCAGLGEVKGRQHELARLRRENHALRCENAALARELACAQQRSQRRAAEYLRRIDVLDAELRLCRQGAQAATTAPAHAPTATEAPRTVLCIGTRRQSLPLVRDELERRGAKLLHHDGGSGGLGPSLRAADLVICQTGCISHDAYWRVQDHCRRTGKRCVFVDTPSRAALAQVWQQLTTPGANRGAEPCVPADAWGAAELLEAPVAQSP